MGCIFPVSLNALPGPHTAKKQGLSSEAVILCPAPRKPEQLRNSGAEIKLHKLQHKGSKSGENPIFQMQEYTGTEFCNKEAPAVFKWMQNYLHSIPEIMNTSV